MAVKYITLKTNYNKKLDCDSFIHVDLAPSTSIRESTMESTEIIIRTEDGSHEPVKAKLVDMLRLPLWKVSNVISFPSHGMDSLTFQDWMMRNVQGIDYEREMAVYFYQRVAS